MNKNKMQYSAKVTAISAAALILAACGGGSNDPAPITPTTPTTPTTPSPVEDINVKPTYLGTISTATYDGASDDLLTAGLGKSGLAAAAPPAPAVPATPTPAELRRIAIHTNYRAIVDASAAGGFGLLYGPNVDLQGNDTLGEGKIAGTEYIAYSDDGSGTQNITMMVQIPASFNPANPCIVTGASSGSRGVYGAIGSSGEWGLKHGCAVAYNDKGTGNGIHDLQADTVSLQNGVRTSRSIAGKSSNFTAPLTDAELTAFNAATPNRFAVKHAHSQQNPEKDWGKWTLQSIEFAYYLLNEKYGNLAQNNTSHLRKFVPANTIVIASSVSNGAGAALAAAEQDTQGLISGIAVAEPHVQLAPDSKLSVKRGATTLVGTGKPLYDYFTLANLLQPCAALASTAANPPFQVIVPAVATARCSALKANGLVTGATTAEQATSALNGLLAAGWQAESNDLQASMYSFATPAIAMTYSNTYGRFSVKDNLCGFSFSGTSASLPTSFGTGNGVPPTGTITIFNNNSVGGAVADSGSTSVSTGAKDYNVDGALCQRELAIGTSANALRVQKGISEAVRTGNLRGKPALIVHGRSDTLIPVAFSSRPYFGVNKMVEGDKSKLSYIEVTNGQHFDAFLGFPGYDSRYIPLHRYYVQAMDLMYANLKSGAALPPSQVVRTTPRGLNAAGTAANPIAVSNVPAIKAAPAAADQITFAGNVVTIPD